MCKRFPNGHIITMIPAVESWMMPDELDRGGVFEQRRTVWVRNNDNPFATWLKKIGFEFCEDDNTLDGTYVTILN